MRRLIGSGLRGACFLMATFVLLEGMLAVWLAWSVLPVAPLARRLYSAELLPPQYDPHCARFDEQLFYVLRPGRCRFETREFSTEIRVDSAGYRDDEESLHAPPIIAVGDSTTMGWGVKEEEAYPALLERRLGVRVLGAGVPSYGTPREIASLDRMDTSALSVLIVQFDANDHAENKFFQTFGRPTSEEARYRRISAQAVADTRYWFGKYTWAAVQAALDQGGPVGMANPRKAGAEVEAFLHALRHASSVDLSDVHVIVFAMEPQNGTFGRRFVKALRSAVAADPDLGWIGRLTPVDVSDIIGPETRFRLDGHIGPEGHRRIAERLAALIARDPGLRRGEARGSP